ncbi:HNH endonuclease [Mongoliibacter ruber]|uniref:HNH endonuclease n=1 Tax=Mongoliibacter ruber TaxID=1750599 RepID=A0A2T0WCU8_9BACT|nr:HNH endonuclease signature motif containing protein [Mongoliibacter ruber]PRY84476.1 HNH endonuclease [Mongoliibacter ruber]
MAQKPYRFSKKAGRYIPNTQSGNRKFYHKLLASIEPYADFDPNSTYGKHIMKKTISDLRKYKLTNEEYSEHKNSLATKIKRLKELQDNNKREEGFRRRNAINKRASEIVQQKNPLVAFLKKRAFLIAVITGIFFHVFFNEIQKSIWVFLGCWVSLSILGNWIFNRIKKSNFFLAQIELKHSDFDQDLRTLELSKKEEIRLNEIEIENFKNQMEILRTKVSLKAQDLLNEDKLKFILSEQFYNSTDWKKIRVQALLSFENVCVNCGSLENLAIDHIYPRSKFPEKALELSNTQILCLKCNSSKGNRMY